MELLILPAPISIAIPPIIPLISISWVPELTLSATGDSNDEAHAVLEKDIKKTRTSARFMDA